MCLYCPNRVLALGLCSMHWQRWRDRVPMDTGRRRKLWTDKKGYVWRWFDGKEIMEHRHIMEQHLKRKLLSSEDVHHRNKNRSDNRLENLEVIDHSDHGRLHHGVWVCECP